MTATIADLCEPDDPALLKWQATCRSCHAARVERILAEAAERRAWRADGLCVDAYECDDGGDDE